MASEDAGHATRKEKTTAGGGCPPFGEYTGKKTCHSQPDWPIDVNRIHRPDCFVEDSSQ